MTPFIINREYKRTDIHKEYGGDGWSGISPSGQYPFIFIFSNHTGKKHGYEDGWENENVFYYSAGGQEGDMTFTRKNIALRDHKISGKRVFLFEGTRKAHVKYSGEMEFLDLGFGETKDKNGKIRKGIKFLLKRKGIELVNYESLYDLSKAKDKKELYGNGIPNVTERKGLVTSRVGQGLYRQRILIRWENECAVTGFHNKQILIASHIVPWKHADDDERLDVNNGILLSPTYDALFDKHLISFENTGKIILSNSIETKAYEKIGVTGNEKIKKLNSDNHNYLERHRSAMIHK